MSPDVTDNNLFVNSLELIRPGRLRKGTNVRDACCTQQRKAYFIGLLVKDIKYQFVSSIVLYFQRFKVNNNAAHKI